MRSAFMPSSAAWPGQDFHIAAYSASVGSGSSRRREQAREQALQQSRNHGRSRRWATCASASNSPRRSATSNIVDGADPELEIGALYELSLEEEHPPVLVFRNIKGYPPGHRIAINVRSSKVFDDGETGPRAGAALPQAPPQADRSDPAGRGRRTGRCWRTCIEGAARQRARLPGAEMARGRRRPLHRHRMHRHHPRPRQRLGQSRHLSRAGAGQGHARRSSSSTASTATSSAANTGSAASTARWRSASASRRCWARSARRRPGRTCRNTTSPAAGSAAPIEVIKGRHTGIPLPADAELVFEGFMPPPEEVAVPEGPFGEWPGYYASSTRPEPVLKVKAIYHRNDPIIVGAPPVKPTLKALHGRRHRLAADPRRRAVGRSRSRRRARHQGRLEDGGRRRRASST